MPGLIGPLQVARAGSLGWIPVDLRALHGGSGTRPEDIRRVSQHGVAKINVGVAVAQAGKTALHDGLRQHPDAELADMLRLMESACQEVVAEYLGWSGSAHKA